MSLSTCLLTFWFLICSPVLGHETNSPFVPSTHLTTDIQDPDWRTVKDAQSRQWNSAHGNFSVTGKLVELSEAKIKISTTDGRNVQVELSKLSPADNEYVESERKKLESDNPFEDVDPFESADDDSPKKSGGWDDSDDDNSLPTTGHVDWRTAELIPLEATSPSKIDRSIWTVQPPKSNTLVAKTDSIHIGNTGFAVSADETVLALTFEDPFGKSGPQPNQRRTGFENRQNPSIDFASDFNIHSRNAGWVELYSTNSGKLVGRYPLPSGKCIVEAVDSASQRLLTVEKPFSGDATFQIWKLEGKNLMPQSSWQMNEKEKHGFNNSIDAWFIDENHVAIQNEDRLLVVKLKPMDAVYSVETGKFPVVRSSDPKLIKVHTDLASYEIDLLAGESFIASSDTGDRPFQPSHGKTLSASGSVVKVHDSNGAVVDEFYAPVVMAKPEFRWLDDDTVVASGFHQEHYIDVTRGVALATVADHSQGTGSTNWEVNKDMGGFNNHSFHVTFVGDRKVRTDQPNLVEIRRRAFKGGEPPQEILRPGDIVALEVMLTANPHLNSLATERLTKLLIDRDVIIGTKENADYILKADDDAEEVEEEYRKTFAFFGETEKVTSRLVKQSVKLTKDDQVVWSSGSAQHLAMVVMMQRKESIQEAVDRQKGKEEDFWKTLSLPKRIVAHPDGKPWYSGIRAMDGKLQSTSAY